MLCTSVRFCSAEQSFHNIICNNCQFQSWCSGPNQESATPSLTFCPTEDKTKKADPTNEWYRLFDHGVHVRLRFIILSPVTQWTHRHQRLCLVQNLNGALGDGADPRDPAWPRRIARVGKRLANTAGPKIYPKKWIPLNNELEKLQGLKQINTDSAENLKFHGVCIQSQLYIGGNTHECTQNWLCLPFTLQY